MGAWPAGLWGLAAAMAAALAGVALQLLQARLWPTAVYGWMSALAALTLLACWLGFRLRWRPAAAPPRPLPLSGAAMAIAMALATAALGFASTGWRAAERLAEALPAALENRDLLLTGTVLSMPQAAANGLRFTFAVEQAQFEGQRVKVPERVSVGWFGGFDGETLLEGPQWDLAAGQRWQFTARLRQPHGPANPHGFDVELWLWEQGLRASGSVRASANAPMRRLNDGVWAAPIERSRQRLRDAVVSALPQQPQAAGVLAALAVGDQGAIGRAQWEVFRDSGVAHLMSISGLHVTMFAWLAGAIVGWAWRRSERLMLWQPAAVAALWGGVLLAGAYALLAGFEVPAQRTWWMLLALAVLRSAGLRWPPLMLLLAAGAVVTAIDPWALLQPGFWLSFCAVGLLMLSGAHVVPEGWRQTLAAGLRTQAVATVGLAPLSLIFFQQLSLVGFAANLVAIPLVTFVVTPLALLGALWAPLWTAGAWAVQGLLLWLQWLLQWQAAVWPAAAAPAWAAVAGLLGAAALVLPLPWRLRLCGLPMLLPLLWPAVPRPPPGQFEAVVVDIGQGTAVLVRTEKHLLLYDTGPQTSPENDAGQRILLPLLRARGERQIDALVLSHQDLDHIGGAASVLAGLAVRQSLSSLSEEHPLRPQLPAHRRCEAGQRWQWDGVAFEVLHPTAADHAAAGRPNALSCVLRVQAAQRGAVPGQSLLLTGDIEAPQEAALLARAAAALAATAAASAPSPLQSDGLLVPHHGSKTSSTAAFIAAVQPRWAAVQAAHFSRFGHPAAPVLARYEAAGVPLWRSNECGALTVFPDGSLACERPTRLRYWHHAGTPQTPR